MDYALRLARESTAAAELRAWPNTLKMVGGSQRVHVFKDSEGDEEVYMVTSASELLVRQ